jgi:hypothetical protein
LHPPAEHHHPWPPASLTRPLRLPPALSGGIIITRKGAAAAADGRPSDVDREFVLMLHAVDERASFLAEANVQEYLPQVHRAGLGLAGCVSVRPC